MRIWRKSGKESASTECGARGRFSSADAETLASLISLFRKSKAFLRSRITFPLESGMTSRPSRCSSMACIMANTWPRAYSSSRMKRSILVRFPICRRAAPSLLNAWRASSVSMTQNTSSWDSPASSRYSPSSTWSGAFPARRKGSAGNSRPGGTCSPVIPLRPAEGHPE